MKWLELKLATSPAGLDPVSQLLEEQDLPPESREYVSALEHQAEKLRFLIDALVKTSRLESGVLAMTPKRHGIQQLLDAASAQAAPGAEAKAITLTVEPTDLTARFDPKWTAEAIGNILDNAVKYTPPGSTVQVSLFREGDQVVLTVEDNGAGIPEEDLPRIFERFYRVDKARSRAAGGTGLGLAIVRDTVEKRGGTVEAANRPGGGAVFTVRWPWREGGGQT